MVSWNAGVWVFVFIWLFVRSTADAWGQIGFVKEIVVYDLWQLFGSFGEFGLLLGVAAGEELRVFGD